jgi:hypothetical protein
MSCYMCTDEDGADCFPLYGLGPHEHRPGPMLGSTVILDDKQDEVAGFTPDPAEPGMGVWWCPQCGSGKPAERTEGCQG